MNCTATNTTSNQAVIYLPTTTWGGTSTQPHTWTTNSYGTLHPDGQKIVEAINKAYTMMLKYEGLINGIIFKELNKRLADLLFSVSCQWGMGLQGQFWGTPNSWTTVPATIPSTTNVGITWDTTTVGTAISTNDVWYTMADLYTNASTTLNTTGLTYTY